MPGPRERTSRSKRSEYTGESQRRFVCPLLGGTVTFLFTDIEGSTRLVARLGERYAFVLADHQRLLRDAFAASAGREIDTQGDAFFVVFPGRRSSARVGGAAARLMRPLQRSSRCCSRRWVQALAAP